MTMVAKITKRNNTKGDNTMDNLITRAVGQKSAIAGQILSTTDYTRFKSIEQNRKINYAHVERLKASMQIQQLMIPICVNENFEVIDGQHRLTALSELELPVYYYIAPGYGVEEMKRANIIASTWNMTDFVKSYQKEGSDAYVFIVDQSELSDLPLTAILDIVTRAAGVSKKELEFHVKQGTLVISDELKTKIEECVMAYDDFKFFERYKTISFRYAFLDIYFNEHYSHEAMRKSLTKANKKKMRSYDGKLNKEGYLYMLINRIYTNRNKTIKYVDGAIEVLAI